MTFYVMSLRTVLLSTVPILGQVQSVTESEILVTVEDGQAVHRTCSVSVDATLGKTQLQSGFLEALPVLSYAWDEGETVDLTLGSIAMGYDPSQSFPTHLKHPAVEDSDSDGKPGVTITLNIPILGEVEMWVAQFTQTTLHGRKVDEGVWAGTAELSQFEQIILKSGHPRLKEPPPIAPGVGSFILTRQPGPTSCEAVLGG